jgi:hypothetical protein
MMGRAWFWGTLAAAALAGGAGAQSAIPVARPAAKPVTVVNGTEVRAEELEAVLKAHGPSPVPLTEAQRRQRQMEALSVLVDNLLWHQFLEKNTPPVPAAEVEKKLQELAAGLKAQGKGLAEFCQDTGQTAEQLRVNLGDNLRWSAYAAKHISDSALEQYYKEYKDFFDGTQVRASHVVLRVPEGTAQADREKARAQLSALRAQIVAGKLDFAAAARKYSQDPAAEQGGDLGLLQRKWFFLDENFLKAAFALKVGEVSDVVQSDLGFHLIKVTDRKEKPERDKPAYASIKEAVREFCAEDLRQQILARERKSAKISPPNLP